MLVTFSYVSFVAVFASLQDIGTALSKAAQQQPVQSEAAIALWNQCELLDY